ncbi:MAG: hypothetical protein P1V81_01835 [Planctomycetota bacterium]|nr:hypothetical protein [Planctomycetota bacterium]
MTHANEPQDLPLGQAEERALDFSLGRIEPDAALVETAEAQALRRLVETVRSQVSLDAAAPSAASIDELRSAARSAAGPGLPGSFWRHLQGGLRTSPWIRLAAASLVIHMAALPVLAWLHFKAPPERALFIRFEEPAEALTSEPTPELLEPLAPEVVEELLLDGQ